MTSTCRCFEKAVSLNDKHCYVMEKVLYQLHVHRIIIKDYLLRDSSLIVWVLLLCSSVLCITSHFPGIICVIIRS